MDIQPPITQVALDYPTIEQAIDMAHIAVKAGIDWLEIGTPLITCQGLPPIGQLVRAFPGKIVLADYKTMDSGGKNVDRTAEQGADVMTVCGNAPDQTIQSAVERSKATGVAVVVDTIGIKDQAARARQCQDWGVDMIYLHYGADQRRADDSQDSTQWLDEVLDAVTIPVGVGTFGIEDAVRAVSHGAQLVCIGYPLISSDDPAGALSQYVSQVKAAYQPRRR